MNDQVPTKLVPRRAPGRQTRKARDYASDIRSLKEAGYTYEAIREALRDVGVVVSKSTVQRECTRRPRSREYRRRSPPGNLLLVDSQTSPDLARQDQAPDLSELDSGHKRTEDALDLFIEILSRETGTGDVSEPADLSPRHCATNEAGTTGDDGALSVNGEHVHGAARSALNVAEASSPAAAEASDEAFRVARRPAGMRPAYLAAAAMVALVFSISLVAVTCPHA